MANEVLADAWRRFMAENREQFAIDLEEAARLLRNGSLDDLEQLTSRNARSRARNLLVALAEQRRRRMTTDGRPVFNLTAEEVARSTHQAMRASKLGRKQFNPSRVVLGSQAPL